ncbi:hypothetical protein ACKKBG_A22705 [Auxenochlorella protothecoides x Auxenochlorella symbiontica]
MTSDGSSSRPTQPSSPEHQSKDDKDRGLVESVHERASVAASTAISVVSQATKTAKDAVRDALEYGRERVSEIKSSVKQEDSTSGSQTSDSAPIINASRGEAQEARAPKDRAARNDAPSDQGPSNEAISETVQPATAARARL